MRRPYELDELVCSCGVRDPAFPLMLTTASASGAGALSWTVALHRTRDRGWEPCPEQNAEPQEGRRRAVVTQEEVTAAAEVAALDANRQNATYWHHALVIELTKQLTRRSNTVLVALRTLERAQTEERLAACRVALAQADLPGDVAEAAWALLPGWHGSPAQLIATSRSLVS